MLDDLEPHAKRLAKLALQQDFVEVVAHIDADGLCSAAIASTALERAGIEHSITFLRQLDGKAIEGFAERDNFMWFVDLGSGMYDELRTRDCIITDHHLPGSTEMEKQLNPHLLGHDGGTEISGAGVTYLVARAMNEENRDAAFLAVVGAVGDMQDNDPCALIGLNREIVKEAGVDAIRDLRYFGRETRPIFKLIQYASDPPIPGVSGLESTAIKFLKGCDVELKEGGSWRCWVDLDSEEKKRIVSSIVKTLLRNGFGFRRAMRVVGEVYVLRGETPGTILHDAREFSTLLNSCGRHSMPEVGVAVCLGDRKEFYKKAMNMLNEHRAALANGVEIVRGLGISRMENIMFFDSGSKIDERIVGIIAGMVLEKERLSKPLIALAVTETGELKISARATRGMVEKGVDLSRSLNTASTKVGGYGGGHKMAAGATIPSERRDEFLHILDALLEKQTIS